MNRFILRYVGKGTPPASDLAHIGGTAGLDVVDESPRMLLVEATSAAVGQLQELAGWEVSPENFVLAPDPRKKVRQSS